MSNARISLLMARSILQQLSDGGLTHLVASPGFRNSPLLLAGHLQEGLEVIPAVDERGGAFLALGLAKTGKSVALLCTSGTAVANYFPAVMEAGHSHIPLLVITGDRPLELVGSGANQCTDQSKVFGPHVRGFVDVDCPWEESPVSLHGRYGAARAAALTQAPIPGPVHLNVRFREPFLPDASEAKDIFAEDIRPKNSWKIIPSASGPSKEQWEAVETVLSSARRPLLLLGAAGLSEKVLRSLLSVSERTGIPVLAENASGLPLLAGRKSFVSSRPDQLLPAFGSGRLEAPDLLVRIGPPLTGRALQGFLKSHPVPQMILDQTGETRESDLYPSIVIQGGLEGWLDAIRNSRLQLQDTEWREKISGFSSLLEKKLKEHLARGELTEWMFHGTLAEKMRDGSAVLVGNSMPIRDFNSVFSPGEKSFAVFSNRGLSGIDGLIASTAGIALGTGGVTHGIIGDLSTLHDLSSLSLLSALKEKIRLTLWVMNNGGGEIFRTVQTARSLGNSEWYTTPQSFDLAALAKSFQIPFLRISSRKEWESLEEGACNGPGVRIIEILPDRESNLLVRRSLGEL